MSSLKRDECRGELHHRQVVPRGALPAHEQPTKPIVPAVGPFDDPASWLALHATDHRLLAATTDVGRDSADADGGFGVLVVVALVQAQVLGPSRTSRRLQRDRVEHRTDHPLVVHVRRRRSHGQRHSSSISEDVSFHAEFPSVRRIRPRVDRPFGAFAMALSSEAKSHLMPRRLS